MKKIKIIQSNLCRIVLAITFIFSGYVKAIDPMGTQYKIEDYLEAISLQNIFPDWLTLTTSILLSALEFSLGIFMLFAIRRRICSKIILFFMIAMTAISIWLVIANPIQDCGCFGDAIKLSNSQTLCKNAILLTCALIVAKWPLDLVRFISKSNQWIVINYTIIFILLSSGLSLYGLPQFDFRPYHIGADIKQEIAIPKGAPQPKFETTFLLRKNGVTKEFTIDNYPDSTWEYVNRKTVQTQKGYEPLIHDFSITTIEKGQKGEDITKRILDDPGYTFLLIAPHLETADDSRFGDIEQIYEFAENHDYGFYCLTASNQSGIKRWQDLTGAEYKFCTTDETTLKTIIRSNPGLLLIKHGVIINKWSHNSLPNQKELEKPLEESSLGKLEKNSIPKKILEIILWFILPLILLTIADRLWAWSKYVKEKVNQGEQKIKKIELDCITTSKKEKKNEKENRSR